MTEVERLVPRYPSRFSEVERILADWWDRPGNGADVIQEFGEWYVVIGERRFSISEQALAIEQRLSSGSR